MGTVRQSDDLSHANIGIQSMYVIETLIDPYLGVGLRMIYGHGSVRIGHRLQNGRVGVLDVWLYFWFSLHDCDSLLFGIHGQ